MPAGREYGEHGRRGGRGGGNPRFFEGRGDGRSRPTGPAPATNEKPPPAGQAGEGVAPVSERRRHAFFWRRRLRAAKAAAPTRPIVNGSGTGSPGTAVTSKL